MSDIIGGIIAFVVIIAGIAFISIFLAFPIMWSWNHAVVPIWELPTITWGQAWCLNFLAQCFIKSTQTNNNK